MNEQLHYKRKKNICDYRSLMVESHERDDKGTLLRFLSFQKGVQEPTVKSVQLETLFVLANNIKMNKILLLDLCVWRKIFYGPFDI